MRRLLGFSALILMGVTPLAGAQGCKQVVGHFEANIVPPGQEHCPADPNAFCTAGRVWGGVQGTYRFAMTAALPSGDFGGVPTEKSQGWFPFGMTCARNQLAGRKNP